MPNPSLATDAWVLLKRPPAETFRTLVVFSAEHGNLTVLLRVTKKPNASHVALDLFDEVFLQLETRNQGQTWFVQDTQLLLRQIEIGRSYETLRLASAFAALVVRNNVVEDSRPGVYALVRTALAAFASPAPPEIVYFKSVYCFARDEGYPLKQQWLPTLPPELRDRAARLLHTPLAELPVASTPAAEVEALQNHLDNYLRGYTDILVG